LKLSNSFEVPIAVVDAWPMLIDIERIVPCMPGAELTDIIGKDAYKGRVTLRLGPVTLAFDGSARFMEIDEQAHFARMEANGTDKKGRGGAVAKVTFQLQPRGDATAVLVGTDLQLSGFIAQYGRGSGIIAEVANQLVKQFAECVSRKITEGTTAKSVMEEVASPSRPSNASAPAVANTPISGLRLAFGAVWNMVFRGIKRWFGTM
jgi:carbon monoxide dehydrogenase subunit G